MRYDDAFLVIKISIVGYIIKVTPSSKTVGYLAQFMVQNKLTEAVLSARLKNYPSLNP